MKNVSINKRYAVTIPRKRTFEDLVEYVKNSGKEYDVIEDENTGTSSIVIGKTKRRQITLGFDNKNRLIRERVNDFRGFKSFSAEYGNNDEIILYKRICDTSYPEDGIFIRTESNSRYFYDNDNKINSVEIITKTTEDSRDGAKEEENCYFAEFKYRPDGSLSYTVYQGDFSSDLGRVRPSKCELMTYICDANGKIIDAVKPEIKNIYFNRSSKQSV